MMQNRTRDSLDQNADHDVDGEDSSFQGHTNKKQRSGNRQETIYIANYTNEDEGNSLSGSNSIGTNENFNANSRPKGSGRQVSASSEKNHVQRLAKAATDSLFTSEDIKYSKTLFLSTFVSFVCIA